MKRKKGIMVGAAGLCMIGLVSACGTSTGNGGNAPGSSGGSNTSTPATSTAPQKGGTLTIALNSEPDNFDPDKTGSAASDVILGQVGASLVYENPKTFKFEPYLATSWETSKDGLTWTFDLRHDVTFQDGSPLTAQDLVKTYQRALDPKNASGAAASFLSDVKSISASDNYTLVFTLKQPFAPFLTYLADPGYMQPIDFAAVAKEGANYGRSPVSVGPWKFDSWQTGQSVTLTPYTNYKWGPSANKNTGAPYPGQLVFKFIPQEQTAIAALKTGEVDIAQIDPKDVSQFSNNANFHVASVETAGMSMAFVFNLDKPSLTLPVRQAINEAIDRHAIIQATESGKATPAYGPMSSSIPDADPNVASYGYHYNPTDAAKLLQKAGYTKNSSGQLVKNGTPLTLDMIVPTGSPNDLTAQMVQAELQQVGIGVKIESMDYATWVSRAAKGQFDIMMMQYSYNDPDILYILFDSNEVGAGYNFNRLKDPALDKLLVEARTTVDQAKRKQLYYQVQKEVVQNAYWAPVFVAQNFYAINNRVHDFEVYPTGLSLADTWVSQK